MNDLTRILSAIDHGDVRAAEQLFPLVYDEPRRLAERWMGQERPGQTPQAAACLNISPSAADRAWRYARAWLYAAKAGAGLGEKIDPA
jgi:hypothetical protein